MLRALATALIAGCLLPASAQAANFCVNGPCPSGAQTHSTLSDAIAAASGNGPQRDRIEVGPGDLVLGNTAHFTNAGNPVDFVGGGATTTRLIGNAGQPIALEVGSTSTVSDLGVRLGAASFLTGIQLEGTATRVRVTAAPGNDDGNGVFLRGGSTLTDSEVAFDPAGTGTAVGAEPLTGTATVRRVTASGFNALRGSPLSGGAVNASQLNLLAGLSGVSAEGAGTVRVSSSLVRLTGSTPSASGLSASTATGSTAPKLEARHMTVVGSGTAGSAGALAETTTGTSASLTLRDSIVQGFANSLVRTGSAGTNNLTTSYSDYPATVSDSSSAAGALTQGAGVTNAAPGFRDAGANDYRLTANSPLLDAGDPAALGSFDSALDLAGATRVADGNADGTSRADMGAYELPRPDPPPITIKDDLPPPVIATKDTLAPALSATSLSRAVFAAGPKSTALAAATKGTTVRYRLSEAATVKLAVERREVGRKVKRKGRTVCAKPTRANRKAARCTRYAPVRTLTRKGTAGPNAVAFSGRLRGKALARGRYRLRITATDAAGNRSATRNLAFRIVR